MPNHWSTARILVLSSLMLVGASVATIAFAQVGGEAPVVRQTVYEFAEQEVLADAIVPTLNDLSKQSWEIFQVVPAWSIRNANGATELVARSYQVFARRPVNGSRTPAPAK
jgi:hypothetical protein